MTRSLRLALVMLPLCGSAAAAQPSGVAPPRFTPTDTALPGLVSDARSLDRDSNAGRFEALVSLLEARGIRYEIQRVPNPGAGADPREEGRNVIVTIGSGDRDIIVGAHYDATRLRDGELSDGMVDNGAAAVVLTRAAAALERFPLRHRVRVVFFDMEEIGLVGSRYFVAHMDTGRVAAMINLDVVGYGGTLLYGPTAERENRGINRSVMRVCGELAFECIAFPRLPPSDDRSFGAAEIPRVALSVLPAVEAHQVWLLVNGGPDSGLQAGFAPRILRIIHTADDTVERLEAAAMARAYDMVMALTLHLDETLSQ